MPAKHHPLLLYAIDMHLLYLIIRDENNLRIRNLPAIIFTTSDHGNAIEITRNPGAKLYIPPLTVVSPSTPVQYVRQAASKLQA